jgi:tyrosine decarboxylase/aspartate 1-decarboxylase
MFGIKTRIVQTIKSSTFASITPNTFPLRGVSKLFIYLYLLVIKREYNKKGQYSNLGWLSTPIRPIAVWAYKFFLDINPNHLGNWSIKQSKPFGTQKLERDVIKKMIDLYHGDNTVIEGYITTGGTEGNLFSMWLGKNYLKAKMKQKGTICLIQTDLTHYSIPKCADIASIDLFTTSLNSKTWNMDPEGLFTTIQGLYKNGYRGFLIPLTLGYTQTGTSDDREAITTIIKKLEIKYKDIHFFLWIDAALNGLIRPFIGKPYKPFSNPFIQTILVDFHKFAGVPYPAGIVLYNKKLRLYIERSINYLPETDSTVLGSRQGASAASMWATLFSLGRQGFKKNIQQQETNKEFFLTKLRIIYPEIQIITGAESLTCGLIIPDHIFNKIPLKIIEQYGFFAKIHTYSFQNRPSWKGKIYKIYFLPHIQRKTIERFLSDLKSLSKI